MTDLLALGASTLFEAAKSPCSLDPAIRPAWSGARLAGPAYTVRCGPGDNLAIHVALERALANSVLVVDCGGFAAGYWGEVLTVAAQARSIAGLIIDGGVRDVDALERLGFPVFARSITVRGTGKFAVPSVGQGLVIAGVFVAPGDTIVADRDGVVALPQARLNEIVAAASERQRKEDAMMDELRAGSTTLTLLGLERWRDGV